MSPPLYMSTDTLDIHTTCIQPAIHIRHMVLYKLPPRSREKVRRERPLSTSLVPHAQLSSPQRLQGCHSD